MSKAGSLNPLAYAGLFALTLATLMYEILLTRIFSVTMWYHFAFMAISVAMFGMTAGAIIVYLLPSRFTQERAPSHLALAAYLFAVTVVISFVVHLFIPFRTDALAFTLSNMASLFFIYVIIAIPFVSGGVCVCIALTKFPRQVSTLYAVDLAGAACGCVLVIYTLKITDGPTAVFAVAFLGGLGAILFALGAGDRRLAAISALTTALLGFAAVGHTILVRQQRPIVRLRNVKGGQQGRIAYEKWNSFSRIAVNGNPDELTTPFGWGLSPTYRRTPSARQLMMAIDAAAGTVITGFDGRLSEVDHLKYDLTNLVHYVRPNSTVVIVGSGGGRDVLSALAFHQRSIRAVEYNEDIIAVVNERFGDFSGHLDRHPKITFVNDEARSYLTRQNELFDIIQVSLIDTWAATAAGAFALTENSLYTIEAWHTFLQRLTDRGMLTFSRWYFPDRPGEMYRLTALASASLLRDGVTNPRKHIAIVRTIQKPKGRRPFGVGTILVGKNPLSAGDVNQIRRVASRMAFEVVLSPTSSIDPLFEKIASGADLDAVVADFPIDISAPTDDRPFFFQMVRLRDMFDAVLTETGALRFNTRAVRVLGLLLCVVIVLTALCIIAPLVMTTERADLRGATPHLLFFACIGMGFMLVEVSQLQRLIVFLGHPTYSLSVVLFSLLVASGAGSFATQGVEGQTLRRPAIMRLALLLATLVAFGILTPLAIDGFRASSTAVRIGVAVAILLPIGFFMGMAFPLGIKLASRESANLTPWLWGVNGATSVCASVVAVAVALAGGISASFWTGVTCYALAIAAFLWASTPGEAPSPARAGGAPVHVDA